MKLSLLINISSTVIGFPVFNITGLEMGDQIEFSNNHFQIHTPHHVRIHRGNRNNRCRGGNREENRKNREDNRRNSKENREIQPESLLRSTSVGTQSLEGSGDILEIFEPNLHRFLKMRKFEDSVMDIEFLPEKKADNKKVFSTKPVETTMTTKSSQPTAESPTTKSSATKETNCSEKYFVKKPFCYGVKAFETTRNWFSSFWK